MTVRALHHVQLAMPPGGEADARRFYGETLGIPEAEKPSHLARRGGCWFERDGLRVHLGVETDFRAARKAHPAFLVENLEIVVARLRLAGADVWTDKPLDGFDRVYTCDPFGNRIELVQELPP